MSLGSLSSGSGGSGSGGGFSGGVGSTDNILVRSDGTGGTTLQGSTIAVTDSGQMSGVLDGSRPNAGGLTLTASLSGSVVTLGVGGGADDVQLPASPQVGTRYVFVVLQASDALTVIAQGSHKIIVGASQSTAGGSASSSTLGARLDLVYAGQNIWSGLSAGTWTFV